MTKSLPTRALREQPDLDQLKRQAKELRAAFAAADRKAVAEVNSHYRGADPATFQLHDAQLVVARAYGFDSWPKLKAYVEGVTAGRLCDAVQRGDIAVVRRMLRRRPEIVNLEWPGHGEYRAIHVAVLRRDSSMVRLLMKMGADARCGIWPHRDATTALTLATERGYQEIVSVMQEEESRRAETQAAAATDDPCRWTPLHRAAARLDERAVSSLVTEGAGVNQKAAGDWTPLDLGASGWEWSKSATPEQFESIARILLAAGATLSAVSAVALGNSGFVRARHAEGRLATATSLDIFRPFGGLLSVAVKHNRPRMLELLLDLGLDPDERVRVEGTEDIEYSWGLPLYNCAASRKYEMAEMLLARGADPNGQVCASGTPVGRAYGAHDEQMVELLVRHCGIVYAANAGYYRDTDLARRLFADDAAGCLRAGTVHAGTTLAEDLLSSAATGGDPEIVRMALARIDWPRDDPRWYWRLCDPLCFWNHMPGIESANPALDRGTYVECFNLILERCNPNLRPERFGQTVLHEVASMRRHVTSEEVVAFAAALLNAGARLDVRDNLLKSTPLGWACRWGRTDLVKLPLERGADPVEAEAEPWATPRAWAAKMGNPDALAVLEAFTR